MGNAGAAALAGGVAPLAALRELRLWYVARPQGLRRGAGGVAGGACVGAFGRTMKAARAGGRRFRRLTGPKIQIDLNLGRRFAGGGGGGGWGVTGSRRRFRNIGAGGHGGGSDRRGA